MLLIFLHIFRKSYQVFLLDIRTISNKLSSSFI
nr:MAG TPA: hypothetical protein [Caudoviricetes sp.]